MPGRRGSSQISVLTVTPSVTTLTLRTPAQVNLPANYVTVIDDITLTVQDDGSASTIYVQLVDDNDVSLYYILGKTFGASEMDTLAKSFPGGLPLWPQTVAAGRGYGNQNSTSGYTFTLSVSGNVHASAVQALTVAYHFEAPSALR